MKDTRENERPTVRGICVPAPRMTKAAAFLIATALSVPVFLILTLGQWILD